MPLKVLVIEGGIAAGKSTLVGFLADHLRAVGQVVAVAHEPVDVWEDMGILAAFYKNPEAMAYPFQSVACMSRIKSMRESYEAAKTAHGRVDVLICERSPLSDKHVFMKLQAGAVGPVIMSIYNYWWSEWMRMVPSEVSDAMATNNWYEVWLRPSADLCMERLLSRSRASEVAGDDAGVTAEYQKRLHAAHQEFLFGEHAPIPKERVIVLGADVADANFRDDAECREKILETLVKGAELV